MTNAHSHRTGTTLARTAWVRGHSVAILTSEPEALTDLPDPSEDCDRRVTIIPYRTFDDLTGLLQQAVKSVSVLDPTSELSRFEERVRREEDYTVLVRYDDDGVKQHEVKPAREEEFVAWKKGQGVTLTVTNLGKVEQAVRR